MTNSGATATLGTLFKATISGCSTLSNHREPTSMTATATPPSTDSANPASVVISV